MPGSRHTGSAVPCFWSAIQLEEASWLLSYDNGNWIYKGWLRLLRRKRLHINVYASVLRLGFGPIGGLVLKFLVFWGFYDRYSIPHYKNFQSDDLVCLVLVFFFCDMWGDSVAEQIRIWNLKWSFKSHHGSVWHVRIRPTAVPHLGFLKHEFLLSKLIHSFE